MQPARLLLRWSTLLCLPLLGLAQHLGVHQLQLGDAPVDPAVVLQLVLLVELRLARVAVLQAGARPVRVSAGLLANLTM